MVRDPDNVNLALARCDLERVIRDHIHRGVDPRQLLGELLEICENLNTLSRIEAPTTGREGLAAGDDGSVPTERPISEAATPPATGELHVKWIKPIT